MSKAAKEEKINRIKTITSFAVRELQKNGGSEEMIQEIQEKGDKAVEELLKGNNDGTIETNE